MQRAFVFDLDGTLLDTLEDLVVATNTTLEMLSFPPRTSDEIRAFVGNGARRLMHLAVPEGTDLVRKNEALELFFRIYPEQGYPNTRPFPGMREALCGLRDRGIALGALSNKFDRAVQEIIAAQLPGCFDVVHGECPEIPRKPDPAGLLHTVRELGGDPESSVYVGDSPVDIEVSKAAGCFALGVSWGFNPAESLVEAGADLVIDDPSDLLTLDLHG